MKLYENAWPSKYEEIKTWYPVWYREVLEMDAIWRAFGRQLDAVQAGIIQSVDNNFIDYADAQAISKLEAFLGVTYDGPRTLTERRNVVKAFILGNGHIGQKEIKELVSVFTNGDIQVALVGGKIEVTVTRDFGDRFNLYDCHLVLDPRIPAHLALGLVDNLLPVNVRNNERLIFRDFKTGISVKEGSAQVSGVSLNGERMLDGSWTLEASYQGIQLVAFKVSLRAKQTYAFTGKIIMDSLWALDGAHALDGTRRLNAALIEEEI